MARLEQHLPACCLHPARQHRPHPPLPLLPLTPAAGDVVDPEDMQEVYGGMAHFIMRPGVVGSAYDERAVLLALLRSVACHRTSVKVGGKWMDGSGLGEMVKEVRSAHTAWADRAPVPFFDEDEGTGEGSQGWAGGDSDGDSEDGGSSGDE